MIYKFHKLQGGNVNMTALWTQLTREELFQGGNRANKAEAERALP